MDARETVAHQASHPCEVCHGARLRPEPLSVKIAGEDISLSSRRSVADALEWFSSLDAKLAPQQREIAHPILKEINARLGFLHNVGLDYLNLDRTSGMLSGGESQRVRLASQIGSGLSGVLYVLDEPSIGLLKENSLARDAAAAEVARQYRRVVEPTRTAFKRRPCHRHGTRGQESRRRSVCAERWRTGWGAR